MQNNVTSNFLIFASLGSVVFGLGGGKMDKCLSELMSSRNMLVVAGVLILLAAGYMYLQCNGLGKSKKAHHRGHKTGKDSSHRSSSTSSSATRKSPRKSKAVQN